MSRRETSGRFARLPRLCPACGTVGSHHRCATAPCLHCDACGHAHEPSTATGPASSGYLVELLDGPDTGQTRPTPSGTIPRWQPHAARTPSRDDLLAAAESATREEIVAWLQWCDPDGSHDDTLAARDGCEPYTRDDAMAAFRSIVEDL